MSSKGRRHESTSDNISVSDIQGIVQKAVAAATEVIRAEFAKLLDELSKRVRQLENSLNDISTEVFNHDISSLQRRVKVLEDGREHHTPIPTDDLRRDIHEVRVCASDNERYSRRQHVRMKGLTVAPDADCCQAVINLCRTRLQLQSIGLQDIDVAHPVAAHSTQSSSASTSNTEVHAQRSGARFSILLRKILGKS